MGRKKSLKLSVLNIVLQPHSREKYIELIIESFCSQKSIKIRGQYYGLPVCIKNNDINLDEGYIKGRFYRYTEIDDSKPWLDLEKSSLIIDEDGNPIPQTPENKRPNSTAIDFIFIIDNHRLVFDRDNISPNSIKDFFTNLFKQSNFTNIEQTNITINIEKSDESIDEILDIYYLTELEILITKPNPDDLENLEQEVVDRLTKINADQLKEDYKSKHHNITPDERTKKLMKISTSNGYCKAKGKDEFNRTVTKSTESHPLVITEFYNPESTTYFEALKQFAFSIVNNIMERFR